MADEIQEGTPAELSPVEQKAQEQGWVPKEQWEGDPDQWRPAKEFLDRGELFKKIDDQNKTIKEFRKSIADLAKHHERVREVEYKRALEELKNQKRTALNEGDADAVIDLDEKIALVRDAQKETPPVVAVPDAPADLDPRFVTWKERNSWYDSNKAMRVYADRIGNEFAAQGLSPSEVLNRVSEEVKKEFSHKFTNPNRERASAVEGSTARGGKSKDSFTLSDDERRVMHRFIKTVPGMTEDKYISDLKAIKGI